MNVSYLVKNKDVKDVRNRLRQILAEREETWQSSDDPSVWIKRLRIFDIEDEGIEFYLALDAFRTPWDNYILPEVVRCTVLQVGRGTRVRIDFDKGFEGILPSIVDGMSDYEMEASDEAGTVFRLHARLGSPIEMEAANGAGAGQPAVSVPIKDSIDKAIFEIVDRDPDLKDDQVSAALAKDPYNIHNKDGSALSRQSINNRRNKLKVMGYRVR